MSLDAAAPDGASMSGMAKLGLASTIARSCHRLGHLSYLTSESRCAVAGKSEMYDYNGRPGPADECFFRLSFLPPSYLYFHG